MKSKSSKIMVSRCSKIFEIFIYFLPKKLIESNIFDVEDLLALQQIIYKLVDTLH